MSQNEILLSKLQESKIISQDSVFNKESFKQQFKIAMQMKATSNGAWGSLIDAIREEFPVFRIRLYGDLHYEAAHRCQIKLNYHEGFHLLISFVQPYFGYYFWNSQPNSDKSYHIPVLNVHNIQPIPCTSYSPWNENQRGQKENISKLVRRFFPSHNEFPVECATQKIYNFVDDGICYPQTDLFQLLFSSDIKPLL